MEHTGKLRDEWIKLVRFFSHCDRMSGRRDLKEQEDRYVWNCGLEDFDPLSLCGSVRDKLQYSQPFLLCILLTIISSTDYHTTY